MPTLFLIPKVKRQTKSFIDILTNIQLPQHILQFIEIAIFMQFEPTFIEFSHIVPFRHLLQTFLELHQFVVFTIVKWENWNAVLELEYVGIWGVID